MSKKNNKKSLGQFFTTNVDKILKGFEKTIIGKDVIDPYAGNGDLLGWAARNGAASTQGRDIDPKYIKTKKCISITKNDSLIEIPKVGNFNITNPPYLGKNKMTKKQKEKYMKNSNVEDFYLLAVKRIIESNIPEGIMIIPVNFLSAENSDKIRAEFLSKYKITNINYFKEQVFEDTTYNVVAFHYTKDDNADKRELNFISYPDEKLFGCIVEQKYSYRIGGKELDDIIKTSNKLKIRRLTENMMTGNGYSVEAFYNNYNIKKTYKVNKYLKDKIDNNIILLNCIDSKVSDKINAADISFYKKDCLVGKNTSRNIAYVLVDGIDTETQSELIGKFNTTLNKLRKKYNSLFLTNFRDNDRKRISFDFCYKLLNWCYEQIQTEQYSFIACSGLSEKEKMQMTLNAIVGTAYGSKKLKRKVAEKIELRRATKRK